MKPFPIDNPGCIKGFILQLRVLFQISVLLLILCACSTQPYTCDDPLGCLEISRDEPVVIGAILATSGPGAQQGLDALAVIKTTLSEHDSLFGHPVNLIQYGTDCTPRSALVGAMEFVLDERLSGVIGPSCPMEEAATATIFRNAGLPWLSPVSDPMQVREMVLRLLDALSAVGIATPQGTLYIPRQALYDLLMIPVR
jgi:hypothetical protein